MSDQSTKPCPPVLPKGCFGFVGATSGVNIEVPPTIVSKAVDRHMANDWGDLDEEDTMANYYAIKEVASSDTVDNSPRVMSVYRDLYRKDLWVISYLRPLADPLATSPDHCNTIVLFPSEY